MTARTSRSRSGLAAVATTALLAGAAALASAPRAEAATASIQITGRISVTSQGGQKANTLSHVLAMDATGRFVAFSTDAALDPADTNGASDAYLRDRMAHTTTRVSLTGAGGQIGGPSALCGMSRNARYVAFAAQGTGLADGASRQLYVRDRTAKTTTIVSVSSAEVPSSTGAGSGISDYEACPISNDGRYVAFVSAGTNLGTGDNNGSQLDVFRRDLQLGVTVQVSTSGVGAKADAAADEPALSADGNVVAFESSATNLVPGDTNAQPDVFVRLVGTSQTFRVSVKGASGQVAGYSVEPSLSADGTKVAFTSAATDLVAGDTNGTTDVFVRDRTTSATTRVSVFSASSQLSADSSAPHLSDDGTRVSFSLDEPNKIVDDENQTADVFLRDITAASLTTMSLALSGSTGDDASYENAIAGDGSAVAFESFASDLVRNDTNGTADVFVCDRSVDLSPFPTMAALVKQQFVDFEGRQPTAAELAEWQARIYNGERTPDRVILDLAHGATWAGKRAPLIRLYWAFFLRTPDKSGLSYWVGKLNSGTPLAKVAKQFAASSEFQTKYGSKTNSQFVTLIYQNIFKRNPDPAGLAYWTGKLDSGAKTRGDVMVNFSESSEGKRVLAPQTDTVLVWLGGTKAVPNAATILEAIDAYAKGYPPEILGESLRDLPAYVARFP